MTCHVIETVVLKGQQETPLCSFGYIMSMSLVPENNQSLEPTDLNSGNFKYPDFIDGFLKKLEILEVLEIRKYKTQNH